MRHRWIPIGVENGKVVYECKHCKQLTNAAHPAREAKPCVENSVEHPRNSANGFISCPHCGKGIKVTMLRVAVPP